MKITTQLLLLLFFFNTSLSVAQSGSTVLFDDDWKFHKGGSLSAEQIQFDDSNWRSVDLPHDWSIENLPGTNSPFNADAISSVGGGFTTGGTGWYRKHFNVPAEQKDKRIYIQFDGVYMNSYVYLNGQLLGNHPYGYTSFEFDITDKVKFGSDNILAVKVSNEGENSRWYSGSGIYRHVWLRIANPVHIANWGTSITTPSVSVSFATVHVKTKVVNDGPSSASTAIVTTILNAAGIEVAKLKTDYPINSKASPEINQDLLVKNPTLWSVESPVLHTLVTEVYNGEVVSDRSETKFGIRTISIDSKQGFSLNGKSLKLKGGCVHHDNGPLGSKAYDRAEERKIEILKASGYNAIRCSHNPPSTAFLDACDRLGMLVIDEAFDIWDVGKNPYDYHLYFNQWWQRDVDAMILRDRNHPSIILWSIGNEIPGMDDPEVVALAKQLSVYIHQLDPTRLVTAAVNSLSERKDPFFSSLDVGGYNYAAGGDHHQKSIYELDHNRLPNRIMFGSESYALEAFGAWMNVVDYPWVIGDFVWTSFDYIGEASIGWRGYWQEQNFYPWNLAYCGDIDICGWKRPQSYYRDALWKENQVSVFVKPPQPSFEENPKRESWSKWHWHDVVSSWNWEGNEGKSLQVDVYSSCEQAELFLNGKSLGKKPTNRSTQFTASWQVPYQSGELKVVGFKGKKKVRESVLRTASEPVQIKLTADRNEIKADGQDLSYITVELVDAKGIRNPKTEDLLSFEIQGPGKIIGIGNANPISVESYQDPERKAWQGRCMVIIKSERRAGQIIVKASSKDLPSSSVSINAK